jgi:hypothetical protein
MNERAHTIRHDCSQHGAVMTPQCVVIRASISEARGCFAFAGVDRDVQSQADDTSRGVEVHIAFDIRGRGTVTGAVDCEIR